ncbi:HNH endonuclease [Rhodococcoides fascians]|uniref:HNH endonuclease n=1 Tax=Nocardiaceae TaxID=85025 RepID=UPI00344E6B8D
MTLRPGRDTAAYRRNRKKLLASTDHHVCHICQLPIDLSLKYPNKYSFSCDHIIPIQQRPDLADEYTNLASAHLHCNASRSSSMPNHISKPNSPHTHSSKSPKAIPVAVTKPVGDPKPLLVSRDWNCGHVTAPCAHCTEYHRERRDEYNAWKARHPEMEFI